MNQGFIKQMLLGVLLFGLLSCIEDEFGSPELNTEDVVIDENQLTTFQALQSRLNQAKANNDRIAVIDEDLIIEGYVISSDKSNNFFEELIVQNTHLAQGSTSNPRLGLKVLINASALYQYFTFGQHVYIRLKGLAIGETNGVLTLGKSNGNTLEQIQQFEYRDFILRTLRIENITARIVSSFTSLNQEDENTYVQCNEVRFLKKELALTYAGEPGDQFDGFRTLENCSDNTKLILETSTFADFKSLQIDQGQGQITGIFKRDFTDSFNVLAVNTSADINLKAQQRCDPAELDCGLSDTIANTVVFEDNFETQLVGQPISNNGWTNFNECGMQLWEAFQSSGNNPSIGISARINSFFSGESSTLAWLITPEIDMDIRENEVLSFQTSNSFADGSELEVLYSNDWDGDETTIAQATWGILPAAYIVQDSDNFTQWFNSGNIDLSCASGKLHIAFRYTGGDNEDFDGTYELDEVRITTN